MKLLLPFIVGCENYAVDLIEVQEVVEDQNIYSFPGAPVSISGVINFHGRVITVINLTQILGFPTAEPGNRLIVLANQKNPVALGVDQVKKIINIDPAKAQQMDTYVDKNYISNIIHHNGKIINLLDLNQLHHQLKLVCNVTGGDNG